VKGFTKSGNFIVSEAEQRKMRMTSMLAGLAIVFAACGGEKKTPEGQPATTTPDQQQPAPAAGGAGKTHDVNMVLEGSSYKYVPDQLTIGPNDVIHYHNKSGGPHNVAFWEDSIPKGAASHIVVPDPMAPLSSKLAVAPDEVLEVKFNDAPKGEYKFHCTPHLALGMKGKLSVQ
jgi:plastocyanin